VPGGRRPQPPRDGAANCRSLLLPHAPGVGHDVEGRRAPAELGVEGCLGPHRQYRKVVHRLRPGGIVVQDHDGLVVPRDARGYGPREAGLDAATGAAPVAGPVAVTLPLWRERG